MPMSPYMMIEGEKQGLITGGACTADSIGNDYVEEHADEFLVLGFDHQVTLPRDPRSGKPTGTRVHQPFVVTKAFDKSSPLLYNALTSGENLPTCEMRWYRTSTMGTLENYFTMKLEDAIIVDIRAYMPNVQDPGNASYTHLETVSLAYRKIEWTHEICGTTGEDDWRAPKKD
ncbi:MAG: Hcp family type VI secretion system effector [Gammaproteobacteria bacterium]|nr:Hcp family type VI secretion system effector [Gammaproteobacteria bacterium]